MGNSSITLQGVIDYANTFGELRPALGNPGYSSQPALAIANDVMSAMLSPSMNWKWNRLNIPPFYTNSWQQDYAIVGVTTLAWIEHAWAIDINNTAIPKPIWPVQSVRDLERTSSIYGRPCQVCWLPNDQLSYGVWGTTGAAATAGNNPGPSMMITNPLGVVSAPANPMVQVKDTNGNFQVVTTYGQTNSVQPTWPAANSAAGTTTGDLSVVWTVVDPKGQGFRLSPVPSQSSVVYQINVVGQMRPPVFTSATPLSTTIDPIPDDYSPHFLRGFVAHCYRHSPEDDVRRKFAGEYALWMESLQAAKGKADREPDSAGFYPDRSILGGGMNYHPGPAWPYPPEGF